MVVVVVGCGGLDWDLQCSERALETAGVAVRGSQLLVGEMLQDVRKRHDWVYGASISRLLHWCY